MMRITNGKKIFKILALILLVLAVFAHEAGWQMDKRSIIKGLDLMAAVIPKPIAAYFGILSSANQGDISVAKAAGIGTYEVKEDPSALNVRNFGAKGDGITDDTEAIQKAINAVPDAGGKVYIPAGTYMVEAMQSIRLKSNMTLLMASGSVLKAIPNGVERYAVLTIENVNHVAVYGGVIQGDRKRHIGQKGEWGTGVQISGSKDVVIQGTAAIDCWGDGFYIGTETFTGSDNIGKTEKVPENIKLIDIKADNNRRQGISIIAGRNVEITRVQLTNTNGTDPESGLDIEPNGPKDIVDNILVTDAVTKGNAGAGILINLSQMVGTSTPANIKIINHRDDGSGQGIRITDVTTSDNSIPGNVVVENPEWDNAKTNGLTITNHDYRSYNIIIKRSVIVNANRKGSRFDITAGSAIAIYHADGNIPSRTGIIGNVTIYNPQISNDAAVAQLISPIYVWDDVPGRLIQKVQIIDPVMVGSMGKSSALDQAKPYIKYTQ